MPSNMHFQSLFICEWHWSSASRPYSFLTPLKSAFRQILYYRLILVPLQLRNFACSSMVVNCTFHMLFELTVLFIQRSLTFGSQLLEGKQFPLQCLS